MPQFVDHHPIAHATMTEEAVERIRTQIRAETPDDFGVKWLGAFVAVNGEDIAFQRLQTWRRWSIPMNGLDT